MKRIIIDSGEKFLRAAAAEEKTLIEFIIEDKQKPSIVGNIYIGIVENILPSRFAFINIGCEKNAFLYLNDPKESALQIKSGMHIAVQVFKDATAIKGPAVTSCLTFTGKYMVLIKNNFVKEEIGMSKKIEDSTERERLKKIAHQLLQKGYGLIIRTAAENVSEEDFSEEYACIFDACSKVIARSKHTKAPSVLYREESVSVKAAKELMTRDVKEIIVNDEVCYSEIVDYINTEKSNVEIIYTDEPVFSSFSLERQIHNALHKKIWLNSGGFLYIEQTEACAVIDVNTGKFVGKKSHSETVTN